jgi:hypothetical protein
MSSKISRIISILFHPVFALFSGLLIVALIPTEPMLNLSSSIYHFDPDLKKNLFVFYGTFTVLFPITGILTLYSTRAISSLELTDKRDRILPVTLVLIIHCILYYFLRRTMVPDVLLSSILGVVIGFLIFLGINFFYKISLHGIGAGLVFGFIFSYYKLQMSFPIVPLIVITLFIGLVGWARIHQKAHTNGQYFWGVLLGALTQIICITFGLLI